MTFPSSDRLSGECETARLRAMSTRRWHRVLVNDRGVYVDQASTTGMTAPTALPRAAAAAPLDPPSEGAAQLHGSRVEDSEDQ